MIDLVVLGNTAVHDLLLGIEAARSTADALSFRLQGIHLEIIVVIAAPSPIDMIGRIVGVVVDVAIEDEAVSAIISLAREEHRMIAIELVEDEGVPLLGRHVVAHKHGHIGIVAQVFDEARHLIDRIGATRLGGIVHLEGSTACSHQRSHCRRLRGGIVTTAVAIEHPRPLEGGRTEIERHGDAFRFGDIADGTRSMRRIFVILHHLSRRGGCTAGDAAFIAILGAEIIVRCALVPTGGDHWADALAKHRKTLTAITGMASSLPFVRR